MRRLPFMAMLMAGACAPPAPSYRPPPPPALTIQGVPQTYEACVQRKVPSIPDMYDLYLECRPELVFYIVQLPGSQQEKAEAVEALDRRAMNRAHEVATAMHGDKASPIRQTQAKPPADSRQAWRDCVTAELHSREIMTGPVAEVALAIAGQCRPLFKGEAHQDVDIVVNAVEKIRAKASDGMTVIERRPMDQMERRF
jgi:uncharacterized protein with PIN domain